jgi:hypothetical protein
MAIAVSLLSQSVGCEPTQPAAPPAVAAAPAKPIVMPTQLEFSDLGMQKSAKFSINGDLRPFWRVQGRIQNHSPYATVTGVRLFISVWGTDGKQDSAVLDLKTNIACQVKRSLSYRSVNCCRHLGSGIGNMRLCRSKLKTTSPVAPPKETALCRTQRPLTLYAADVPGQEEE